MHLRPDFVPALVNLALLQNSLGANIEAERLLRQAATAAPSNVAVHLNLGMLLGEQKPTEARAAFLEALRCDPSNAAAAFNLGVIAAPTNLAQAMEWTRHTLVFRSVCGCCRL
ncbi:MAG: tetratricopeptide repeat protein [Verrucomicrobia bacterium]|nr:MAG: tetratricopeptide repeat protein [Verrucomicrobiota bacterium]